MIDGQRDADGVAEVVSQDHDDLRGGDAEAEEPSIDDVTGVAKNMTILLIGCVTGTVTKEKGVQKCGKFA